MKGTVFTGVWLSTPRGRDYLPWMGRGYLPWIEGRGTYLGIGEGVLTLDGGGVTTLDGEGYLPWMGGVTTLGWGVPTLDWGGGTYPWTGEALITLDKGRVYLPLDWRRGTYPGVPPNPQEIEKQSKYLLRSRRTFLYLILFYFPFHHNKISLHLRTSTICVC